MDIALFELDHTLIPFDSAVAFTRHLIDEGVLEPDFEAEYPQSFRCVSRARIAPSRADPQCLGPKASAKSGLESLP